MNKRGLSPLVATVLLIAFAVSLGAVVMNLGVSIVKDPCSNAKVEILLANSVHKVCFDNKLNVVNVALANNEVPVDGVKITMTGDTVEVYESYQPFGTLDKQVLVIPTTSLKKIDVFSILPFINTGKKIKYCADAIIDYSPIPSC
ncbi:MAG TPA: archaellin/type IV pilin N-terminal domain-containing protein [Acidobacteriota bacterium]|nr:archaellin/type IV pilin N-terminal domain-containing protein [Acidobacteriota bacterium]